MATRAEVGVRIAHRDLPHEDQANILPGQHMPHDLLSGHTNETSGVAGVIGKTSVEGPIKDWHDVRIRWSRPLEIVLCPHNSPISYVLSKSVLTAHFFGITLRHVGHHPPDLLRRPLHCQGISCGYDPNGIDRKDVCHRRPLVVILCSSAAKRLEEIEGRARLDINPACNRRVASK